jgi:hypothetical protein
MYTVWIRKIFMLMTQKVTGVCPSPWTCNTCELSPTSGFSWLFERCKFIVVRSLPARYRSSETSTTTKGEETDVANLPWKFSSFSRCHCPLQIDLDRRLIERFFVPFVLSVKGMFWGDVSLMCGPFVVIHMCARGSWRSGCPWTRSVNK